MRVTNGMIMKNAASNINSTKEIVDKRNTQMTTQKKISKPSDDPVTAVRSLRLSTTLSTVTQYYSKNIPDATSWLDVTETALINSRDIVADCRTLANKGATGSLNQEDRQTILNQLESLQSQLYSEGNADYAGRTVFTGFRTDCNLTFTEDETTTVYEISQTINAGDGIEEFRYYDGSVTVPTDQTSVENGEISDIAETSWYKLRAAYDEIKEDSVSAFSYSYTDENEITYTNTYDFSTNTWTQTAKDKDENVYTLTDSGVSAVDKDGNTITATITMEKVNYTITQYDNETEWADYCHTVNLDENGDPVLGKTVEDDEIVFIAETGEFVFGSNVTNTLMNNNCDISFTYTREGFKEGELRPEYYYNCTKTADENATKLPIEYVKFDEDGNEMTYDINYTVANGQTITVNTEACNVFDSALQRDLGEMIDAVTNAINAHDKLDTITAMMSESQYQDEKYQTRLQEWLDAAQKEADYADENLQKLYETEIGKIDVYYDKINVAVTDLGCKVDSVTLTKTRMSDQKETVEELQSENDDVDLSQIIIDYTAAYTAYQASLVAAGKLGDVTLLNYL